MSLGHDDGFLLIWGYPEVWTTRTTMPSPQSALLVRLSYVIN